MQIIAQFIQAETFLISIYLMKQLMMVLFSPLSAHLKLPYTMMQLKILSLNLHLYQTVKILLKLTWRLDRVDGNNASHDDFLPQNTTIKINDIELLTEGSSVAEFIFDLSIDGSYYSSMDTDLDGEESSWLEQEYPNQIKNISVGAPSIYLSDYQDKYGNIFSDWAFTKSDYYPTINPKIEEDNIGGTIENEFLIKMPLGTNSNFKFKNSTSPSNSAGLDLSYEVIDAGQTLKVTSNNGSVDDKDLDLELINIELDFVDLDDDEFVGPVVFELDVNNGFENIDATVTILLELVNLLYLLMILMNMRYLF